MFKSRNLPSFINLTTPKGSIEGVKVAQSYFDRAVGYLGHSEPLQEGQAILINPCNNIHMFFMRVPLDVVFLNYNWEVVRVERDVKPWHAPLKCRGAKMVLEAAPGTIERQGLREGAQCGWTVTPGMHVVPF